jgi:hypothetical protein
MKKIQEFPDEIERWPVEMIAHVDAKSIRDRFSLLAREVLDKIKKRI